MRFIHLSFMAAATFALVLGAPTNFALAKTVIVGAPVTPVTRPSFNGNEGGGNK